MRVFVGLGLSEEGRRGVEKVVKQVKRGHWPVKWEGSEKWHVTLGFLGEMEEKRVGEVVEAVRLGVKGIKPFEVGFKGLGVFPDFMLPRIVWIGLKGDLQSMARVYKGVRRGLEEVGFELDKKPFKGHVTLGRVKKEAKRKQRMELGKYLKKQRELGIVHKWWVDKVRVYESRLKTEGSEYKVITSIKLEG